MNRSALKKPLSLALSLAVALSLVGIGAHGNARAQSTVTLTYLNGSVQEIAWYNSVIKRFEAANPGIKVVQEFDKDASAKLNVQLAAGSPPDMAAVAMPQTLIDQGTFVDVTNDPLWKRIPVAVKDEATDAHGKNYIVPSLLNVTGLFYNKQVIAQLGIKEPRTWDQFVADLKLVKAKRPNMVPLFEAGAKDTWVLGHLVAYFPMNYYQQTLGRDKALQLMNADSPAIRWDKPGGPMVTFARDLLSLQKAGLINDNVVTASHDEQMAAIATGRSPFVIQGMWDYTSIVQKNPKIPLGFWPLPAMYPGTRPHMVEWPTGGIAILSASKYRAEDEKFIDFVASPPIAAEQAKLLSGPSVFKDVNVNWSPLSGAVDADLKQSYVADWPAGPVGYNGNDMGATVESLLAGSISSPQDFATQFQQNWTKGFPKH